MAQFTIEQEHQLERDMMAHRHQPIPNSNYLYGEDVGYCAGGWADYTDVQIYQIRKTKALIRIYGEKQKFYWIPLKHLFKKKVENQ